jgi:hypothetical protein
MGYKTAADGVTKTGKTKGKNLGDSGPTVGNYKGPKAGKSSLNTDMKKMGRNLARAKNQG